MPSIHPSQLPGLVTDAGYGVMIEAYDQELAVRSQLFETRFINPSDEGFTEKVIIGDDEPDVIERGEVAPSRTLDEGYQWFHKVKKLAEKVEITEEMMSDPNATAKIGDMIATLSRRYGQGFQRKKERMAADIFNKGAFTAGHLATFDGSYPGHDDNYPKFIYDGKPFFAASGNGHPLFGAASVTPYNATANTLTSTNLETVRILMTRTNAVDEFNREISIMPDVLLVPPELEQTADVILGSVQAPGTAQNDINTQRGRYRRISWRYLSDTDGWILGKARQGLMQYELRTGPMMSVEPKNDGSGTMIVRWRDYYGVGVTNWRYWSGHRLPTS